VRRAHSALDVQLLDLLPVLGQQRDEEVDSQGDVLEVVFGGERDVADGDTKASGLLALKLELNGALQVLHVLGHGFVLGDHSGELTGLVKTGA